MAELDFAFLADAVRLEPNGILNALGVGYTHVMIDDLPCAHPVSVAGRAWLEAEDSLVELTLKVDGPNNTFSISSSGILQALDGEPDRHGRRSATFLIELVVPVVETGSYNFTLNLDDEMVKRFTFQAEMAASA